MDYLNKSKQFGQDMWKGESSIAKVVKALVIIVLVMFLVNVSKRIYIGYKKYSEGSPWILKGTKDAKKRMILLQDPSKFGSKTLGRSENEYSGLEFSYSFWTYIDDWSYKYGQWKHVMHKGNTSSWPLRAPGIWLHPKKNAMRVYMNTFKNIGEYADISNLPLNKWFHTVVAVRQRNLDIYVNGNLAKRHTLSSIPKQNFGDLYINAFRGFGGYMSNIRYFDYYITYSEMDNALGSGPSSMPCIDSKEMPPYFTPNWWANA
jgi:hypothetical protein